MRINQLHAAVFACLLASVPLAAQNANGRITGTITDNTGAVVPKVQITVTNQSTKLDWKTTSDDKGFYTVTNLPVGQYNVEAVANGFRHALQTGYDLPDSGRISANFKLELGGVSQTVTQRIQSGDELDSALSRIHQHQLLQKRFQFQLQCAPGACDQAPRQHALHHQLHLVPRTRGYTRQLQLHDGLNRIR